MECFDIEQYDVDIMEFMRSCVKSGYPILYLVTYEEEKGDRLIRDLATAMRPAAEKDDPLACDLAGGPMVVLEWNMAHSRVDFKNKRPMKEHYYTDLSETLHNWLLQWETLDNHFLVIRDAHLALRDKDPKALMAVARLKALANKIVHGNSINATIFLVSSESYVPPELEKFITICDLPLPEADEIEWLIRCHAKKHDYEKWMGKKVIRSLIQALQGLSKYEIICLLNRAYQFGGFISHEDVKLVTDEKRQAVKKSGYLEMVPVTEGIDDIGGLEVLKGWLKRKAKIMDDLSAAQNFGVETPKGAMIVGMPGCGKSLTAKTTSVLFKVPLLRLDFGMVMGRYVGESEANMRRALGLAEAISPCVLWVDELEKAFAGISSGASSDVPMRLFGSFLTWMQENAKPVFVLATANNVSALPPELLRKGRFDEIFHVDLPNEHERAAILGMHLKRRKKDVPRSVVMELARKSCGFSGADLEGVVKDAIEQAFVDGKAKLVTDHLLRAMEENRSHAMMMKDEAEKLRNKLEKMGIRSASDQG